jgi:hypothetical protein
MLKIFRRRDGRFPDIARSRERLHFKFEDFSDG